MRLPRFVHVETNRHGAEVIYFRRSSGPRARLPSLNHPNFKRAYAAALAGMPIPHQPKPGGPIRKVILCERALSANWRGAQARAASRGLPFTISEEWVLATAKQQQFRCALTGIPFLSEPRGTSAKHPFAPSLDRIQPALGYTPDNVRIVIFAINMMMADWGEAVFERVANAYRTEVEKRASIPAP